MELKCNGENLTARELQEIADNFHITEHARARIKERLLDEKEIIEVLKKPLLAFWNTDYSVNVAKDKFNYLVFEWSIEEEKWILLTYKEESHNGIDIFKKQSLAKLGKDRKTQKQKTCIMSKLRELENAFVNVKIKT